MRQGEGLGSGIGPGDRGGKGGGAAGQRGDCGKIHRPALGMKVEPALRQLGHLRHAAGDGHACNRMRAQVFQHAADEIAHLDQGGFLQPVQLLHRQFGVAPGGAGDVVQADGAGDVYAAMDAVDPGGAGKRNDDAGGAEDRQAADDAEARVQRALRQGLAIGDGDFHDQVGIVVPGRLGQGGADHLAWDGVDGGFARRDRQAGPCDRADAGTGAEQDAGAGRAAPEGGADQGAVRYVRVVAGVLHHACGRAAGSQAGFRQREGGVAAARQGDLDGIGERAAVERHAGGLGRRGGAGARGPATAKRTLILHGIFYIGTFRRCHGGRSAAA